MPVLPTTVAAPEWLALDDGGVNWRGQRKTTAPTTGELPADRTIHCNVHGKARIRITSIAADENRSSGAMQPSPSNSRPSDPSSHSWLGLVPLVYQADIEDDSARMNSLSLPSLPSAMIHT